MLHRFHTFESEEYHFVLAANQQLRTLEELCNECGLEIIDTSVNKAHDEVVIWLGQPVYHDNGLRIVATEDHSTQGKVWHYTVVDRPKVIRRASSSLSMPVKFTDPKQAVQLAKNALSNRLIKLDLLEH